MTCFDCKYMDRYNFKKNKDNKCKCLLLHKDVQLGFSCEEWSSVSVLKKESVQSKEKATVQPIIVYHDTNRPDLIPFGHQKAAIERYKNEDDIALFFEMGCGKSYTILQIAQEKFRQGAIKGILIVAPNDVHRQWFNELVYGVDKDYNGVMYQELQIDFEAQCVGGRGGQKELYPIEENRARKMIRRCQMTNAASFTKAAFCYTTISTAQSTPKVCTYSLPPSTTSSSGLASAPNDGRSVAS